MSASTTTLVIVHVTDVYKLDNFPGLKTLIDQTKEKYPKAKVVSILTGDFLAPYLLSSLDKGRAMIQMLNETPIDYVIFGNHEDDIPHAETCNRIKEYKGVWVNTNMRNHAMFEFQKDVAYIKIESEDGSNKRNIALLGVLTNSPSLYRPNPFGGATIEDPHEVLGIYKKKLEEGPEKVDLIIPLCHLYVPQDKITCERFDFPLVLSGHDHHVVDTVIEGSRLLKPGLDAEQAFVITIDWESPEKTSPVIDATLIKIPSLPPHPELQAKVASSYSVLEHLRNTELTPVPPQFRPLSSNGSRQRISTVAQFLWTCVREALNQPREGGEPTEGGDGNADGPFVDCVVITGAEIRGSKDYSDDCFFSLEDAKSELAEQVETRLLLMPGQVLLDGIIETHGGPNPGYLQYDDGVVFDKDGKTLLSIAGKPFDPSKLYKVAGNDWDIQEGCPTWIEYYKQNPKHVLRGHWPIYPTIISFFAFNVWKQLWNKLDKNGGGKIDEEEFGVLDLDGDKRVSKLEMLTTLRQLVGFEVDEQELGFVDCLMQLAGDANKDGFITLEELNARPPVQLKEIS